MEREFPRSINIYFHELGNSTIRILPSQRCQARSFLPERYPIGKFAIGEEKVHGLFVNKYLGSNCTKWPR